MKGTDGSEGGVVHYHYHHRHRRRDNNNNQQQPTTTRKAQKSSLPCNRKLDQASHIMTRAERKMIVWSDEKRFMAMGEEEE
jgi:hypothetical protein